MPLPVTTHTEGERILAHLGKIALRVFPHIYRFILSKVYPPTPFVCKSLANNQDDLKAKLSTNEITILENVSNNGYSDFTLVLCYKLFVYFKWFDPPKQKWGNEPKESDIELADDIERIRCFSNVIYSSPLNSISKDSYDVIIEKLRNVCGRIERYFEVPGQFLSEMDLTEDMSSQEIHDFIDRLNHHDYIPDNPFLCDNITLGRNRYAKFGLVVVEMMPKVAREIIAHNIPPRTLYNLINTARRNDPAKLDKFITHDERVSLNTLRNGTYEDLDFTTIYKLIRAFTLVDEPAQGWGKQPLMHDCAIADDIERLRERRNCIVHKIGTNISQTTFEEYFSEFLTIAKRVDPYLRKSTGTGFETEVQNYKTCSLDYELEQKYNQALQKIENMKYRFTDRRFHFYYGDSFERFIETVKAELAKHEKRSITIVVPSDVDMKEEARILNEMKTEINEGQVYIELERAETGSLILLINMLDVIISSDSFPKEVGNFIERILQLIYSADNLKQEFNVVLIHEEDGIDLDFVTEDDDLIACSTEMPVDSKSLRLSVNVDSEVFRSKDLLHTELANFINKVTDANGIEGKSDARAILTTQVSEVTQLSLYSNTDSTSVEDTPSCKYCYKQFPCDQCSVRRKEMEFLTEDNKRMAQTIKDLQLERLKLEPELKRSGYRFTSSSLRLSKERTRLQETEITPPKLTTGVSKEFGASEPIKFSKVPANIRGRITKEIEKWKKDDMMFVKTRAGTCVLESLKTESCVTVTGSSGVGKTFTVRHVALQMTEDGYDILPVTNPEDIINFHTPNKKTIFVIDNFCGTYTLNQNALDKWKSMSDTITKILKDKVIKIIASCRSQVYQDVLFKTLALFTSCECNLMSDKLCLSLTERQSLAEAYLKTDASKISQYVDLYDYFPLLCKLYKENPNSDVTDFFKNPFIDSY